MRRFTASCVVLALVVTSLVGIGSRTSADAAGAADFDPAQLSTEPLFARWGVVGKGPNSHADEGHQGVDGWTGPQPEVWDIEEHGDRVFVGGIFTGVRRNEFWYPNDPIHDQAFVAAFERDTGDWISTWRPDLDGVVYDVSITDDGVLLVGGEFTQVNGVARTGLVGLDPDTGQIVDTFAASVSREWSTDPAYVKEIHVDGQDVYVAGQFSHVTDANGQTNIRSVVRLDATTGARDTSWNVTADGSVWDVQVDRSRDLVHLVGYFNSLDGLNNTDRMGTVRRSDGTAIAGLPPLPKNNTLNTDTVTIARGRDRTWVGGGNHLVNVLHPTTNQALFTRTVERAGDIQVIENFGDWMALGHHGSDGGVAFFHAETYQRSPVNLGSQRRSYGIWALELTSDGCLWVGGDSIRSLDGDWMGGFGRFCPEPDSDGDGIRDSSDTVPTSGSSISQAGTATQSSVYAGDPTTFGPQVSLDANRGGYYPADDISHTNWEREPWWEVDLGRPTRISGINVWNRTDGLGERLDGVEVLIGDAPFGDVDLATARAAARYRVTIPDAGRVSQLAIPGVTGRYVRLQLPTSQYLQLAEVDVFTSVDTDGDGIDDAVDTVPTAGSSISQNGTATQDGDWLWNGLALSADGAIDGQRGGSWQEAGNLAHTLERWEPWWELDLGIVADIEGINVWNRVDCCADRLDNAVVMIGDAPFGDISFAAAQAQATWTGTIGDAGVVEQLAVPNVTGRYVRIQDPDTTILNLIEVDVFGSESNAVEFGTPPNVQLTTNFVDQVGISWDPVGNVRGYLVHRDFQFLKWVPAGTTSFLDETVATGETYRYQVRAQAFDGSYSAPSPTQSITVAQAEVLPPFGTPANVTLGTNGADEVTIGWERVADAKGYVIHRDYQFVRWVGAGESSWTDTGLAAGETYRYQVRAQARDNSYSAPSPIQSITVFDENGLPPFGTPANPAVTTNGVDAATISWEPVADAKGYVIHRDFQFLRFVPFTETSWVDTTVEAGHTYRYQVRAQAADNSYSAPTATQMITIGTDVTPPDAPTGVVAVRSADGTSITITWDPAVDDIGVTSYLIHDNWNYLAWVPANTTSYTHTGLDPASVHRYQIRARDAADNTSQPSTLVRVDPN